MALGVAVATAVLTGALLVGDSVRGSLRDLTLQRLGRIDSALVAGTCSARLWPMNWQPTPIFKQHFTAAEPAILVTGTLQTGSGDDVRRATSVSIVGCAAAVLDARAAVDRRNRSRTTRSRSPSRSP